MLVNSGSAHCGESDQFEGSGNSVGERIRDQQKWWFGCSRRGKVANQLYQTAPF